MWLLEVKSRIACLRDRGIGDILCKIFQICTRWKERKQLKTSWEKVSPQKPIENKIPLIDRDPKEWWFRSYGFHLSGRQNKTNKKNEITIGHCLRTYIHVLVILGLPEHLMKCFVQNRYLICFFLLSSVE